MLFFQKRNWHMEKGLKMRNTTVKVKKMVTVLKDEI